MDDDLIIVGGGPAGVMAGLLFARAGCTVRVLEKHGDFFRDFRGDTVHPSTMEILDQLGMLQRFLERPHDKLDGARVRVGAEEYSIIDLSHLDTPAPFIAMMPQWEFLDFLRDEAEKYRGFKLEMEAPVEAFVEEGARIVGARLKDGRALRADLSSPRTVDPRWCGRLACYPSKRLALRWMCSGSAYPRLTIPGTRYGLRCKRDAWSC